MLKDNKGNQKEINEFFTSDKTDWYTENRLGDRIWNIEYLNKFWELILVEKIKKEDFVFQDFVFPSFTNTGKKELNLAHNHFLRILSNTKQLQERSISFYNCRFQGDALFIGKIQNITKNVPFPFINIKSLNFKYCIFNDDFRLQGFEIKEQLNIQNCEFYGESDLILNKLNGSLTLDHLKFENSFHLLANKISNNTNLNNLTFNSKSSLNRNSFNGHFLYTESVFNGNSIFRENIYHQNSSFAFLRFNEKSLIQDDSYNHCNFQGIEFSQNNHLFERLKPEMNQIINFKDIIFNNQVTFRDCNMSLITFSKSHISDINFVSCVWNSNKRLIMKNELNEGANEKESLNNLEDFYRQLKRNFEANKDWELSGKAYVSEMTIRKKRLKIDNEYFPWFIYSFYDFFGGYTQNFKRPFISLVVSSILVFPILYLIFESNLQNIDETTKFFYEIKIVLQKSISATFPFLKSKLYSENWWLSSFQTIFSSILLAFFILALRKRFKQ